MLRPRVACALSLAAALAVPGRTAAQQETASFTGRLVNRETRAPIEGATVVLVGTAGTATSDSAGGFRYAGLSPGDHRLEVRAIGYAKGVWLVSLAAGEQAHEFELDEAAGEAGGLLLGRGPSRNRKCRRETQRARDPRTKHGYPSGSKRTRRGGRW